MKVDCPCGALFGGDANNGASDGFAYANANNVPANANTNIGSRLYFLRINVLWTMTAPLGEKIHFQ
jgi:hypothetical protein